jgi:hypothetical protein
MDWTEVIRQAEMIAAAPPPGYVNIGQLAKGSALDIPSARGTVEPLQ